MAGMTPIFIPYFINTTSGGSASNIDMLIGIVAILTLVQGLFSILYVFYGYSYYHRSDADDLMLLFLMIILAPFGIITFPCCIIHYLITKIKGE